MKYIKERLPNGKEKNSYYIIDGCYNRICVYTRFVESTLYNYSIITAFLTNIKRQHPPYRGLTALFQYKLCYTQDVGGFINSFLRQYKPTQEASSTKRKAILTLKCPTPR